MLIFIKLNFEFLCRVNVYYLYMLLLLCYFVAFEVGIIYKALYIKGIIYKRCTNARVNHHIIVNYILYDIVDIVYLQIQYIIT